MVIRYFTSLYNILLHTATLFFFLVFQDQWLDIIWQKGKGDYALHPINWTIHGREIQLFCYITTNRGEWKWLCHMINSCYKTGFTQYLLFHYRRDKMTFCICLSILILIEANIVLNKCLHYLVRASHDSGLFGTIFIFRFYTVSRVHSTQMLSMITIIFQSLLF